MKNFEIFSVTKRKIIILAILIFLTLISSLGVIPQIRCYREHGCPEVQQPFPFGNILFTTIFKILTGIPYFLVYGILRPIASGVFLIDTNITFYSRLFGIFNLFLTLIYQYILANIIIYFKRK
ncbi:MAG: hypothetical protein AABW58_02555 [Nanoarchaeota archaeon]